MSPPAMMVESVQLMELNELLTLLFETLMALLVLLVMDATWLEVLLLEAKPIPQSLTLACAFCSRF